MVRPVSRNTGISSGPVRPVRTGAAARTASGVATNPAAHQGVAAVSASVRTAATASNAWYRMRVLLSPRRTANVILPDCPSVGMSRKLLATNTADDSAPVVTANTRPTQSTRNAWVYWAPSRATSPKTTNPAPPQNPAKPCGLAPPVYSQAPAMQNAPTAISQ